MRDDFHVMGIAELVDRRRDNEPISAAQQNFSVAGERRGVARHGNHDRDCAFGEFTRLRFGSLAGWIEHDRIEVF